MSWDSSEVEKNRTLSRKEMVTACSGIEKELNACLETIHANTRTTQDAIAHALLLQSIIKKWIPEQPQGSTSPTENQDDPEAAQGIISGGETELRNNIEDMFPKTMGDDFEGKTLRTDKGYGDRILYCRQTAEHHT